MSISGFVRENAAVLGLLVTVLIFVIGGFVGFYLYLEDRLNELDRGLSNVQGQLDVLKSVLQYHVVTTTFTTISISVTTTGVTPPGGVPGYPLESIIIGLVLGILLLLYTRRKLTAKTTRR
jgi:uncharacterized membrane-anchored protein